MQRSSCASLAALLVTGAFAHQEPGAPATAVPLTPEELAIVLELSPLPPPPPDPTNAVADDPAAARLGQALFFDATLAGPGTVSCATCHDPAQSWTDGRALARGLANHPRHTMTLWNVAHNRWFFWDGRKDSLWSQALAPLEDPREHGGSRLQVAHRLASDPGYARAYAEVFGPLPDLSDARRFPPEGRPVPEEPEHAHNVAWSSMDPDDQFLIDRIFADAGKAIAAFERRIESRRAPFDVFVEGLRTGDPAKLAALDERARRGLALFIGKARCLFCHDGPNFTDLEFHDNRIPVSEQGSDPGRKLGLRKLQKDPFNSRGPFADDGGETARAKLGFLVQDSHGVTKEFKTPTLRNVARTAPYMHEGQFPTLASVIEFYSTLANASPESENERLIQPLGLSSEEKADLVAFLESLTDESLPAELLGPPATPYLPRD
jgi:cytochrome c peroxidase